jgi:hypothetical protein
MGNYYCRENVNFIFVIGAPAASAQQRCCHKKLATWFFY